MKLRRLSPVLIAVLLAFSGCAKKEIPPLQRKQAAHLVSEAEFAATIRDYARAENLLAQATTLCPDTGAYWVSLGSTRVRLNQRDAAKSAFKQALKAFEAAEKNKDEQVEAAVQQIYVLALMGQVDDARALQTKLLKRYPDERRIRAFVEEKRLDRMLADPAFKAFAL